MNDLSRVTATESRTRAFQGRELLPLLLSFGLLIALRLPHAWAEGRFQDEEATVFLAYAWNFPWQEALFRSFGGYLNIAANGSTLALATAIKAGVVPLSHAPYVTMLLGLLFQLAPVALLLGAKASWLPNRQSRLAAAALVVLAPGTEEVFLNVLHIQFHLALSVAIILTLDRPRTRSARFLFAAALFLAPLCGPGAIVFLPLYALRAWVERDPARAWQSVWLGAGAAIQLLFFYHSSPIRGSPADPFVLLAGLLIRLVVLPLGGPLPAVALGLEARDDLMAGGLLVPLLALVSVAVFAALAWWVTRRRDAAPWLFLSALMVAAVSLGAGIATRPDQAAAAILTALPGPRYNYLPIALMGLTLIAIARREDRRQRLPAVGLIASLLIVGAASYRMTLPTYAEGPSWRAEVAAFEADSGHQLAVWPLPFSADLSGRGQRCPERVDPAGNPDDPRYCESGWVAAFYHAQ